MGEKGSGGRDGGRENSRRKKTFGHGFFNQGQSCAVDPCDKTQMLKKLKLQFQHQQRGPGSALLLRNLWALESNCTKSENSILLRHGCLWQQKIMSLKDKVNKCKVNKGKINKGKGTKGK